MITTKPAIKYWLREAEIKNMEREVMKWSQSQHTVIESLRAELAEQKAMTDDYVTRMGENLERAVRAERELAEAREDLELLDDAQADSIKILARSNRMERERDQWREVAEELELWINQHSVSYGNKPKAAIEEIRVKLGKLKEVRSE